jgi:peptide/nickel transport system substrate-binding protein
MRYSLFSYLKKYQKEECMRSVFLGITVVLLGLLVIGPNNQWSIAQEMAKDQVVVLGLPSGDIATIDPMGGVVLQDRALMHHVFGALVRHPIGDCAAGEFQPDLATKWEVSSDKLTWTFHLRKGVKWHWGYGEFTAEDVLYSLNRVKNSSISAFRSTYDNIKEVKAVDKYTVQITTSKPEPYLLTKVANYFGGWIVCKKALEKAGKFDKALSPVKDEAVGTGPWKFVEYIPKDRVTMIRNDDYWEGKPIIEKITFRYIPDDTARELSILKGEIAGYYGLAESKWLKHMKSKGILVDPMGPTDLKALYFNLKIKPFDDKRVREAFAYATSQASIIKMQGEDISGYCTSPVPSGLHGHVDAGWAKYKYDPGKAKKLLAEAGYPNGLTVKLFMSVAHWYSDKMVIFQNELKEAGINLEMTQVDHTVYKSKITQGLNPFVIWGSKLPLSSNWLRDFYHTDSIIGTPKANSNWMYYSNPEVDKLIELSETSFDEKARLDALSKAQKIIVQDLPATPVVETMNPMVRVPWLDLGYKPKNNFIWNYEMGIKTKILKH